MASWSDPDKRSSKDKNARQPFSQSSRLFAPTRSSLAKSAPKAAGENERGRRLSDVTDLNSHATRDSHRDSKARRSSFPNEEGGRESKGEETIRGGSSKGTGSRSSGVSAGSSKTRNAGTGRQDRSYGDNSSPDKALRSPPDRSVKSSPEKGRAGLKLVNTGSTPGRVQGRTTNSSRNDDGRTGGSETTAGQKDTKRRPTIPALPTSPRARPEAYPTSPRALSKPDTFPTSPRAVGGRTDSLQRSPHGEKRLTDSSRTSSRKEKSSVQRSTLLPSQRSIGQQDSQLSTSGNDPLGLRAWQQGLDSQGLYGEGEDWSSDAGARHRAEVDEIMDEGREYLDGAAPVLQGWPAGVVSREALMQKQASIPLQRETAQAADASAVSTSERSSTMDDDDEIHKPSGVGRKGGKADEGSPVSVLDARAADTVHLIKPQDILPKVSMAQSSVQVSAWQGDHHEDGLNAAAAAVAAAIGSPLPAYLLDVSSLDFMGDITGMEQDLEYVRHVLLLSGFAGKILPPVYSEVNPIHPGVFEQLEQGITTGSVEGAHDAIIIDKARQAEERRQRRLLFDAVNEALGRRLMPYYARPVWVKPSQPLIKKLPLGKNLLQEVWEEIHDWPIASSEEVYDILDDAARRDMSRGTERWAEMGQEKAESVFELERLILEELMEEVALEFCGMESVKKEKRAAAKKPAPSKARRELLLGR